MAWYRTGTATFTLSSNAVTGQGTTWITNGNIKAGECVIAPDGKLYEIAAVVSDTSITLVSNYLSTTAPTASYAIMPTQALVRDLITSTTSLISTYSTAVTGVAAGKFGDGALATTGISFTSDTNTGIFRKASDSISVVTNGIDRLNVDASGTVLLGTTTNTHSSQLVSSGGISETVSAVQYKVFSEYDIGTGAAQIPLNQTLGSMAFQSEDGINVGIAYANELRLDKTITAGTGNQTINKPAGSVIFATSAGSLIVTNNLVTTNSVILVTVASNDTTMKSVIVVAAAGSFTLTPNVVPTANTRVNFLVIN